MIANIFLWDQPTFTELSEVEQLCFFNVMDIIILIVIDSYPVDPLIKDMIKTIPISLSKKILRLWLVETLGSMNPLNS